MKTFLTEVVSRAALSACMMISTSGNRIADAPREIPQIIVGSERRRTRATQTDQLERRVAAECAVIVLGLVVGQNALDPLTDHRQVRVQDFTPARVAQCRRKPRGPSNRLIKLPDRQQPRLAHQLRLRNLDFDRPLPREIEDKRQHTLQLLPGLPAALKC